MHLCKSDIFDSEVLLQTFQITSNYDILISRPRAELKWVQAGS
jgi:hypothetical protein